VALGAILDDEQLVAAGDAHYAIHVAHVAVEVDGDDGPRAGVTAAPTALGSSCGRRAARRRRRARPRLAAQKDEAMNGRACRSPRRPARGPGRPGDVQGACAARCGDGEFRAAPAGEPLLELHPPRARPVVHLAGAQRAGGIADGCFGEAGPPGPRCAAGGLSASIASSRPWRASSVATPRSSLCRSLARRGRGVKAAVDARSAAWYECPRSLCGA